MTTPRVGMRTPRRMAGASVLRYSGGSAQELAPRAEQPVGIELEIGAPLGDPALLVDQDDEAPVHDPLARGGAETEGPHHAPDVVGRTRQEVPAREVEPVRARVAAQHLRAVGGRIEGDRDEA